MRIIGWFRVKAFVVGFCLFVAGVCFYLGTAPADDTGSRLLAQVGPQVFVLAIPSRHYSGGTGFVVRAPSGMRYTVTNGHVCDVGEGNRLDTQIGGDRFAAVTIIEQSPTDDLCLTTVVPGSVGALELATAETNHLYVVGHPHLHPNTFAEGYVVGRSQILMAEPHHEPCTGPGWRMESVPTVFGINESICVRELDAVETSLVIYPGNSGSPVLNRLGEVVGVVFAGASDTNYGSMVPLDRLKAFLAKY